MGKSLTFFAKLIISIYVAFGVAGVLASSFLLDAGDNRVKTLLASFITPPTATLARWVQLAPGDDGACTLPGDGETSNCPLALSVRAILPARAKCAAISITPPGAEPVAMQDRPFAHLDGYSGFRAIRVCEARLPPALGVLRFSDGKDIYLSRKWGGQAADDRGRMVVVGDSGCRDKWRKNPSKRQRCDPQSWPFAEISDRAAADKPDLVLHVGDYMYVDADAWSAWREAFFEPAHKLLAAAPWVMVRGNHERCGKHGQAPHGYYLFFGLGKVRACDDDNSHRKKKDTGDAELEDTYALDLSQGHRLIVVDNSTAFMPDVDAAVAAPIATRIDHVRRLAEGLEDQTVWLTGHVPVFALESEDDSTSCASPSGKDCGAVSPKSSAMMYAAWPKSGIPGLDAIISGDRHLFQIIQPDANNDLLQITVGTAGVNLDPAPLTPPSNKTCRAPKDLRAIDPASNVTATIKTWRHCSNQSWGYLLAQRNGGGYEFEFQPYR